MKFLKLVASLSALALVANVAHAQDNGALLDLLVKKKVITDQEAEATRAQLAKEFATSSAGKINISAPVKQITLYGDARLRYDYREANALGAPVAKSTDNASADQFRYRLRIGVNATLTDDWFFGFRLETSNNPRSTNVTFSNGATTAPFGKGGTTATAGNVTKVDFGSSIFVGQLYLRYAPYSWMTLEAGKLPNPLVTTAMVWDPDINPEGVAEQFKYTFGPYGGTPDTTTPDGKGGKDVVTPGESGGLSFDVFANLAQFVYETATPQNQFGSSAAGRNDTWLFAYQTGVKANFSKTLYVQAAPTYYEYSGEKNNDFSAFYSGDPGKNQIGINNLKVIDIPAEFGFTAFHLPFRVFTDYAINLDSNLRAARAGHAGAGGQNYAWQAGLAINKVKKKGDWEVQAYWQKSEQYALDPNLVDNDIFDAHLNLQGIVFRAGYALSDAVILNLTLNHAEIINKGLGTGGAGGTLNGSSSSPTQRNYNLIQADLNLKF